MINEWSAEFRPNFRLIGLLFRGRFPSTTSVVGLSATLAPANSAQSNLSVQAPLRFGITALPANSKSHPEHSTPKTYTGAIPLGRRGNSLQGPNLDVNLATLFKPDKGIYDCPFKTCLLSGNRNRLRYVPSLHVSDMERFVNSSPVFIHIYPLLRLESTATLTLTTLISSLGTCVPLSFKPPCST